MVVLGFSIACAAIGLTVAAQSPEPKQSTERSIVAARNSERLDEMVRRVDKMEDIHVSERMAVVENKIDSIHTMLWAGLMGIVGLLAEAFYRTVGRKEI